MTEPTAKPSRSWWKYLLVFTGAASLLSLGLLIYVNTEGFQSLVRRRLVAEVERITGGRAEVGSIHTTPFRLQVDVRNLTVHGHESATDIPLAHAERIVARLKISSLLRSELAFDEVILQQPVIHVALYRDGTTNFPQRKASAFSAPDAVEQLFALSINRFELRGGRLDWNDQIVPLDLAARNISLEMDYSFLHQQYDGRLLLGLVETKLMECRPFAWMTTAEFSLASRSATITSLQWNSGHSHLTANGQISDFRHPRLAGAYDAQLDLTELASIARRRDLRSGNLELKGSGNWSLDQFASNGLLTLRDLAWQDDHLAFSGAFLTAGYAVSDQQLKLSRLQGKIFGGSFAGDAEIDQWLASEQHLSSTAKKNLDTTIISAGLPPGKSTQKNAKPLAPNPPAIQTARFLLHLRDLSAEDIAAALNVPEHPLSLLHPAGSASGILETRWKGTPRDAELQFALDVAPPAHPVPPQRPITAHAEGVYYLSTDTLNLPQFRLTTPTSHIQASGTLSSASAVRLSVSTSSLADWLPFFSAVRGPAMFPIMLNGSATLNGNMSGSLSAPQLTGALQVADFDFTIPATAHTHQLQTHWDSLSTSLQLSFHSVALREAKLRHDDTSADFDASAALLNGHLTGDSAFMLHANLHNAELTQLLNILGYDYPITANADLSMEASGTFSDPHGEGQIHLNRATAYGESIQQFSANFQLARGEISIDNAHLAYNDSVIAGSAAYNPTSRAFRLDIAGNNFDLARISRIQSNRLSPEGRANFTLQGSGTPEAPSLNGSLHVFNLTLDHELLGDLELQAVTQASELHLTGTSSLQHGSLLVGGNVQLRGNYPANLSFRMNQLDLDVLWNSYARGQLTGHSAVDGLLEFRGPLRNPSQWNLGATLTSLSFDLENVKLHNQDPIRFTLANQVVNIQQFHMLGEGTDLTAHGSVQISGARTLDLAADGRLDLKLLSSFDPDFASSGVVTMKLTVGGTVAEPLPQGRLQVANGALSYASLPSGLSELNGSLLFTRDRIHVETLTAHTGGGTLDLKGDATYLSRQLNFNLTASGKEVRLRYPPGVSSTADIELRWIGARSASTISGDITINRMAITPGFDFGSYLDRSRQGATLTTANSPLNNVKLDIHVQTSPALQMRTAIARLSGDADLRLRGSVARPAVLGRVDILEGRATMHGIHFTLERGDITFANPVAIEPQFDLQASTHVRNYDLNITVTGTPDHGLNINYRSEPPLPKSDIIALLALGRTGDESSQLQQQSGQSVFSDQATDLILNQALNDTTSSRFQRLFGASNIKIDPQGLNTETNPTARGPQVTIEQQFANNISLTYSTNVSQSSEQIIEGEYYINRNVSVVGTRDQNGVVSFDIQVRRRKK
ncbi:MAG: translocation/assembly module TamB domain-containing protein [Candidatus Sulfotelmatobacter sp.]